MPNLPVFAAAVATAFLLPGPDMLLVLRTAAVGKPQGVATVAGLALARVTHVALVGLGLAALMTASPWTLLVLKIAAALYLLRIGLAMLGSAPATAGRTTPEPVRAVGLPLGRAFAAGFACNALNPKALIFCSMILPGFVDAGAPLAGQYLALGVTLVSMGIAYDLTLVQAGHALARAAAGRPRLGRGAHVALGLSMLGFAGVMAASV